MEEIGSGGFFQKYFEPAIAVDKRTGLLCQPVAIAVDKVFDDPIADPNGQLPTTRRLNVPLRDAGR